MTASNSRTWARAWLALAASVLLVADGVGQSPAVHRAVVQSTGLPGIDRGIRNNDAPTAVGGRRRHREQMQRLDGRPSETLYVRGSVIVKFRSDSGSATNSAMRAVGGSRTHRPSYADFEIMEIPVDADPESVSAALRERPEVEYAQPRYRNHAMQRRPNDPYYGQQWNFPAIDMERAWEIQPEAGSEITVAVLDTGVAFRNMTLRYESRTPVRITPGGPLFPALGSVEVPFAVAPELGEAKFVAPYDFIWDDAFPFDLDGHGTHVSGTIGQLTDNNLGVAGMAYNVRIMPVKVLDDSVWDFIFDSPFTSSDDTVARAIRYAVDNGAKVINMSFGREEGGPATVVTEAIRYAVSRGAFVAVSAGNLAQEGNAPSRTAESAPSIDGMMAVGAVGRTLQRAPYSTTNSYVEIAAPGGDFRIDGTTGGILQQTLDLDLLETYSLGPERFGPPRADAFALYYFQGTSMAAPHVSALAAMLMQQGITDPAAVEQAIKQFARDLGRAGVDNEYGHGLIQPRTTLRGLGLAR